MLIAKINKTTPTINTIQFHCLFLVCWICALFYNAGGKGSIFLNRDITNKMIKEVSNVIIYNNVIGF